MSKKILTMELLNGKYGVCRLDKTESIPEWAKESKFFSATKTSDEVSIVCDEDNIPNGIVAEKDWRILKIIGPLDFSLIGILSSVSTVLAQKRISIFAISTYDTDYILVKNIDLDNALFALTNEGYEVIK
ncbi:ACT domain-containing protein [Geosporobacter ferrireducens]|uniref:Amino acid-binding protein n=1 Tax=Geosporobacter ferrireducens TaxID=1424294 RepID=A0A1D8GDR0_9FIRM|nr:ACT domain-containing protein [Geosporobacter ferrireducens]AOT69002.1 amino acid-binding protein [Geosporobacter ferrireducens]MTI58329.1 ACT domain-containing protein [Geosporobacter ferrireducens]